MDQITASVATFVPYSPAGTTAAISVGASPFTYTAGGAPEVIYISGGVVSNIARHGTSLVNSLPVTVLLPAGGQVTITYTVAPLMITDH